MKKLCVLILTILLFSSFVACAPDQPVTDRTGTQGDGPTVSETQAVTEPEPPASIPPHQALIATEATFDMKDMLRISIPHVGLTDVVVCDASRKYVRLDKSTWGQVYLLGDYRYGVSCDQYLAVAIDDKIIVKDLLAYEGHFNFGGYIELQDFDGDGDCEILLQQTVAMSGGAGGYLSRVLDYKDGVLIETFSSEDFLDKSDSNTTGFSITLMEDQYFKIENTITGYEEIFRLEDRGPEYFKYWYGEDGKVYQKQIMVDSFYEFEPLDVDNDGVFEIACRQYVSLIGHSDGIGSAITVLKYNPKTTSFEIVDAGFELWK